MIEPAGYRLLIKAEDIQYQTEWGFDLLPDEKLERAAQMYGYIVAIGKEAWGKDEPWAKIGDRICFVKHAGKFIKDPDTEEEYVLINDEDVLAVIGEEDE